MLAKVKLAALLIWSLVFLWPVAVFAQQPRPLTGITFAGMVTRDASGIFTYTYRIVNPPDNNAEVYAIEIDLTRAFDEADLSTQGLVNGPRFASYGSQYALQAVPTVPVGIAGPQGSTYAIGETQDPTQGFASWGALETFNIRPGNSLTGFELKSYGLPGIRDFRVEPWVADFVPPDLVEWSQLNAFYQQFTFRGKTVGPVAPKRVFVAIDFLNYLISLVHESYGRAWIKNQDIQQSMVAKLTSAKRQLEQHDNPSAKNLIGAFLNDVNAVACQDFSCPGNDSLSSEGYTLLFFNGHYLFDRL